MINVQDLRYRYPRAAAPTLHGLSFSVAKQEIFGFLGPSGSGKSTTQKTLIGLLSGFDGKVQVMGRDVTGWGADYYQHIGVSFEFPNHHQRLTAIENLEHFGSLYSEPIIDPHEVLRWVGLQDDSDKRVSEYSKGMKIRLNIARSLLHRPKLLFLDEPTSGLDPTNARRVKELILQVRDQGATVFMTTHDMTVADQLCDRIGFITSGRLTVVDAPSTLKRRYGRRSVDVGFVDSGEIMHREFPLDGLANNPGFLAILKDKKVETIHSQETTLENVFIEVTGEALNL
ncbi:MAG: ABC transporter ATP-binding protein [Myxococcales bacterium]|nr:ABC transporter ATP-binding protein [Myxococcales bacterium]